MYAGNSDGHEAAVGSRPTDLSWVGALDMAGNVQEFTSSLFKPYPYDPADGREDPSDPGLRVIRGGSWQAPNGDVTASAYSLRAAARAGWDPNTGSPAIGFRCALTQ